MNLPTVIGVAAGTLALGTAAVRSMRFAITHWRSYVRRRRQPSSREHDAPISQARPNPPRRTFPTVISNGTVPADISRPPDYQRPWEVHESRNALAILKAAHEDEWNDLLAVLRAFKLPKSAIQRVGGNRSAIHRTLASSLYEKGWREERFEMLPHPGGSVSSVDCFKAGIAVEIQWNNKDVFFTHVLNDFRLLFGLGAIEVGVIITRCDDLRQILSQVQPAYRYGAAMTYMSRLLPKIEAGHAGDCPVVAFGISADLYKENA